MDKLDPKWGCKLRKEGDLCGLIKKERDKKDE